MTNINNFLISQKDIFSTVVSDYILDYLSDEKKLTPIFGELLTQLQTYLTHGGKWHRPSLAVIGYRIAGGKQENKLRTGFAALELIHRYLLIHDDIVDQDLVRHGLPTLEKYYALRFESNFGDKQDLTYSKGMAMIAGDIVSAMALDLMNQIDCDDKIIRHLNTAISKLQIETAAGWQIQTEQNFMDIEKVTEDDFVKGMELVSARYSFIWPLRIGQILSGNTQSEKYNVHLETYGYHAGLAFQIRDDYLGMFGDESSTGKPVGHDYREGKKTLYLLRAYAKSDQNIKKFLETSLGLSPTKDDVNKARQIIIETKALDEINDLASHHVLLANQALEKINTDNHEAVELLKQLANLAVERVS